MLLALCRGPYLHLPFRGDVVAVFACAHKLSIGTANQLTNWAAHRVPQQGVVEVLSRGNRINPCVSGLGVLP